MELVYFLLIGGFVGWLAGQIMKGRGFGIVGNIVVGVLGAVLGGWIFGAAGIYPDGGLLASLVVALVGAVVLLAIVSTLKKA